MFYYRNRQILKTLGQFENLAFVIMSTRENIRLIARAPSWSKENCKDLLHYSCFYLIHHETTFFISFYGIKERKYIIKDVTNEGLKMIQTDSSINTLKLSLLIRVILLSKTI